MSTNDKHNLNNPDLYINREVSLLEFNYRVLKQATFEEVPLLERLRYLCISSSNLDEFFEIRVAGLKQVANIDTVQTGPDSTHPQELLSRLHTKARELVNEQYRLLNEVLIPELEKEEIRFLRRENWNDKQRAWLKTFFQNELLPMLSPMGLDPAHPFPLLLNKNLSFIITLEGKDAFGRERDLAVLPAPRSLPRVIKLPAEESGSGPNDFVFLSSIIHAHIDEIFTGMKVKGCYQFRITRNSDLFVDEEEVDDLLHAVEGELPSRRYGEGVRLETADNCPPELNQYLCDRFELKEHELYNCNGPVNLNRLMQIPDLVDRPDLTFPLFTPGIPKSISGYESVFQAIRKSDILLHHPFDSFTPVIDFLTQAAADPNVMAIRQTIYRAGPDSKVIAALTKAARAGKEVTVVIELRARFDEEANIGMAHQLQSAGAHVVYGVVGYKTHAKMIQVVRREEGKLRNYIHLGTGNYHASTARFYTDYGLLTCDKKLAEDVNQLFQQLTGLGLSSTMNKMLQSPFTLYTGIIDRIERETEHAKAGKPARIIAKMNALVEPNVIRALYSASQAGVKIDLIIRGICCLRPKIEGVSDNIRVVSIVGRFLEHPRIFYFLNNGKDEVFGSSADWMVRNLHKRVESCFPYEEKVIKQRVIDDLTLYLQDNTQAWDLNADGSYSHKKRRKGAKAITAQRLLLEELSSLE